MDGLLIVDKPSGPTSHDVVARIRRALRERRIGHTGTLDPAATGVLALVLGKATRLAQFLNGSDKAYEAVVRLGFSTDTGDAQGRAIGQAASGAMPDRAAIEAALDRFRGTFLQQPPAFSAKKIGGKRSHTLARARARAIRPALPAPPALPDRVRVTAHAITIIAVDGDRVTLTVDCSAGFYVRSLAHDLGEQLRVGGHLVALRRTRSGDFGLADAIDLETAEREPDLLAARVIPLASMLPGLVSIVLTQEGVRKAMHGRALGALDCVSGFGTLESGLVAPRDSQLPTPDSRPPTPDSRLYRLLDGAGSLVAIARSSSQREVLHPSVVLM